MWAGDILHTRKLTKADRAIEPKNVLLMENVGRVFGLTVDEVHRRLLAFDSTVYVNPRQIGEGVCASKEEYLAFLAREEKANGVDA